jgi:hypothetical protein
MSRNGQCARDDRQMPALHPYIRPNGAEGIMDQVNTRGAGALAIATGIASVVLLAIHPDGAAKDFAGMLKAEAASRLIDGVVHGGFILVLALQAAAYAMLSARLGWRLPAVIAFALFAAGAIALSGSMLFDGLVTPALAEHILPHPDRYEADRPLFLFIGVLISVLMPLGLAFQSAAVAAWGWALTASGKRIAGIAGLLLGLALLAAAMTSFAALNPIALMAGIAGLALWAVIAGVVLIRG